MDIEQEYTDLKYFEEFLNVSKSDILLLLLYNKIENNFFNYRRFFGIT